MSENKFLKQYYEMACHNLLCCSKNYGMTESKDGMEKEWQEYQEEIEFLKSLMNEFEPHELELPAIDKYTLLKLLKGYVNEDDQCGGDCMNCDLSEPCEKLRNSVQAIFNGAVIKHPVTINILSSELKESLIEELFKEMITRLNAAALGT